MVKEIVNVLVEGGKATAGPPLGPALGPMGVNTMEVVNKINAETREFQGMKVPVDVIIDVGAKTFEIKVGTPPTSALVKKELKLEKASQKPGTDLVGNVSFDIVKKVAKMKEKEMLASGPKSSIMEVLGTMRSMGIKCEGKLPQEIQKEIKEGKWDKRIE